MSLINVDLSDTIVSWRNKTNQIAVNLGDLSLLTDSAASVVAGINILTSRVSSLEDDMYDSTGVLTALNTSNKTSIVDAINELDRRSIDVYNSSGVLLNS
jgi:GTP-sensing pleiotropic transcriptional regulator CodY